MPKIAVLGGTGYLASLIKNQNKPLFVVEGDPKKLGLILPDR